MEETEEPHHVQFNCGSQVDYTQEGNRIDVRLGFLRARHLYEISVDLHLGEIIVDVKDRSVDKSPRLSSQENTGDSTVRCVFYLESDHNERLEKRLEIDTKDPVTHKVLDHYVVYFHAQVLDKTQGTPLLKPNVVAVKSLESDED